MRFNPDFNDFLGLRLQRRLRCSASLAGIAGALAILAACTAKEGARSSQEISTAVDRADDGVTAGPTGGPTADTRTHRGLDDQELRRLHDAARAAFVSSTGSPTSFTIVPKNIDAEPTVVSAAPAGAAETRASGAVCRPIRLSATKDGRVTTGTLTFCRTADSTDIAPATSI